MADTDAPSAAEAPADAFAHLEKTETQRVTVRSKTERLTDLARLSERQNADPYTVSRALRSRLREDKRRDHEREQADEAVRERYGLDRGLKLVDVDPGEAKDAWSKVQRSGVELPQDKDSLAAAIVENTKRKAMAATFEVPSPMHSARRHQAAAALGLRRKEERRLPAAGLVVYGSSGEDDDE